MRLAVELLVARQVQDSWGTSRELTYPRMRYELVIARRNGTRGPEGVSLMREALTPIPRHGDRWTRAYNLNTGGAWVPPMTGGRSPLISTDAEEAKSAITLHQDGRGGGLRRVAAERAKRTVLSGIQTTGVSARPCSGRGNALLALLESPRRRPAQVQPRVGAR